MKIFVSLSFLLTFAVFGAHAQEVLTGERRSDFAPYEALVKFKGDGRDLIDLPEVSSREVGGGIYHVKFDSIAGGRSDNYARATWDFIDHLRSRKDVQYAHPNWKFSFSAAPNDALYSSQWNLQVIGAEAAWAQTWANAQGHSNLRIAVLDSGKTTHPDLAGKWHSLERNVVTSSNSAVDMNNWRHGTHVASIIGASTNNSIGTAGVCPNCTLVAVKIDDYGTIYADYLIDGINWSIAQGVRVINLSLVLDSLPCNHFSLGALKDTVDAATASDVFIVAAAGNYSDDAIHYAPANCSGVISVAAIDSSNQLAPYSNYGNVTLAAPGGGGFLTLHHTALMEQELDA